MVILGTMEEKMRFLTVAEDRIDGRLFLVYRIKGYPFILFKYDVELLDSFPMTEEEKDLGVRLCLEARLKNNVWFGDILNPVELL